MPRARRVDACQMGSDLEEALAFQIKAAGLPEPVRQARLVPGRLFRHDFAWPAHRVCCEVQGGIWVGKSGHRTARGVMRDCAKANLACLAGYRTLFFTGEMIKSGEALQVLEEALAAIGAVAYYG